MYAVAEFEGKELSIILLLWLSDDRTFCYWPPVKTQNQLKLRLINQVINYDDTWKKFKIIKIHCSTG